MLRRCVVDRNHPYDRGNFANEAARTVGPAPFSNSEDLRDLSRGYHKRDFTPEADLFANSEDPRSLSTCPKEAFGKSL
jgi:hypothetical protein